MFYGVPLRQPASCCVKMMAESETVENEFTADRPDMLNTIARRSVNGMRLSSQFFRQVDRLSN